MQWDISKLYLVSLFQQWYFGGHFQEHCFQHIDRCPNPPPNERRIKRYIKTYPFWPMHYSNLHQMLLYFNSKISNFVNIECDVFDPLDLLWHCWQSEGAWTLSGCHWCWIHMWSSQCLEYQYHWISSFSPTTNPKNS